MLDNHNILFTPAREATSYSFKLTTFGKFITTRPYYDPNQESCMTGRHHDIAPNTFKATLKSIFRRSWTIRRYTMSCLEQLRYSTKENKHKEIHWRKAAKWKIGVYIWCVIHKMNFVTKTWTLTELAKKKLKTAHKIKRFMWNVTYWDWEKNIFIR